MMRFLLNFLRSYSIFSEVLKMNVRGGVQIYGSYPPYWEAGDTFSPYPPGSDAIVPTVDVDRGLAAGLSADAGRALRSVLSRIF